MTPAKLRLRCYAAKEKSGLWHTVCIDLNLVASGDDFKEAKNKLHEMISDYVDEAFNEDEKYFDQLIPRKAPFSFILRYWLINILINLKSFIKDSSVKLYNEHLPLVPQTCSCINQSGIQRTTSKRNFASAMG